MIGIDKMLISCSLSPVLFLKPEKIPISNDFIMLCYICQVMNRMEKHSLPCKCRDVLGLRGGGLGLGQHRD